MGKFAHAAVIAAGFAALSAAAMPARAADLTPSLQSFGTAKAISAYELSAPGMAGGDVQAGVATTLTGSPLGLTAAILRLQRAAWPEPGAGRWPRPGSGRRASPDMTQPLSCRRSPRPI